jgi:Protein of unknown function (DUF3047)
MRPRRRYLPPTWAASALVVLLAGSVPMASAQSPLLTPLTPLAGTGDAPATPWAYAGLPDQAPPATRYGVVALDGQRVLQVQAERSYGNLVHRLDGVPAGVLAWRWRVDRPAQGADLRRKAGDDTALKVCAMFDLPRRAVPFLERQLLRLAESRTGQALPNATLCYVWDSSLPQGTLLDNAYTRRVRIIVLGGAPAQWRAERRDLAADFLRAFGDEAASAPPLRAIAVGADTDNTGASTLGYLAALELLPR